MLVYGYNEVMKEADRWTKRAYEVLGGDWSKEGLYADWMIHRITEAYEDHYTKAVDALKGIQKYARIVKDCERHSDDIKERCKYFRAKYCYHTK